ncbi:MAG: RNA pseudouridine synthase, partial [candidate division Zixibacteria bacterium]
YGLATLTRLKLQTGRTHQIRVHMSYFGHPVAGDPTYGGRSSYVRRLLKKDKIDATTILGMLDRQALHAVELELPHPDDGRTLKFESELPEDIMSVLTYLKQR